MDLDLAGLAAFHSVSVHGSVTRASEAMGLTQPAVTKRLKQLERSVGVRLLNRAGRGVRLTQEGELLADYAQRTVALLEEARAAVQDCTALRRGRLAIGASPTVGSYLLPEALFRFRQRFPGIELRVEIGSSDVIRALLRDGTIELAFGEVALPSPEFDPSVFFADELVAIVARAHKLARRRSVSAQALSHEAFIVREPGSGTRSLVERTLSAHGIKVTPVISLGSTEAVKRAVAAGLGVSIISRLVVGHEASAGTLAVLRLRDVSMRRAIYAIRAARHRETKAAIAFSCLLKHVALGNARKPRTGRR